MLQFKKTLKWTVFIIGAMFGLFVLAQISSIAGSRSTAEQVAKIHATKLTLDDVMGKNLPPDPGSEVDKTIPGVDANKNGIRDDVERAIFKAYPNSAKTRAALLQYALALQMEAVQPMVNGGTVGEVANKQDRAFFCLAKIIPENGESGVIIAMETYGKYMTGKQFNTEIRKKAHKEFYSNLKSGRIDDSIPCDIDLSLFSN